MLANCAIRNEKVLFLDADEYVTPDFVRELRQLMNSAADFSSIIIKPALFSWAASALCVRTSQDQAHILARREICGIWGQGICGCRGRRIFGDACPYHAP